VKTPLRPFGGSSGSWVDRITAAFDRWPIPVWVPYLVLFVVPAAVIGFAAMVRGSFPQENLPFFMLAGFWTVFPLALIHHLDRFAGRALDQFRPVCDLDDIATEDLRRRLTTMPAGPAAAAGALGAGFVLVFYLIAPDLYQVIQTTPLQFGAGLVVLMLNFTLLGALTYHTVRQLRLVSDVYGRAVRLDLFNLSPLYAFSALAARTAIAWALAIYLSAIIFPQLTENEFALAVVIVQAALLVTVFTLPLVGIHRRIQAAKDRSVGEVGTALRKAVDEINRRADSLRLDDMDALNKMVTALIASREVLAKVPTWPWSPGTPVAVGSALLLPVMLFLIERVLGNFLGL
jgi:hypothetical protein